MPEEVVRELQALREALGRREAELERQRGEVSHLTGRLQVGGVEGRC